MRGVYTEQNEVFTPSKAFTLNAVKRGVYTEQSELTNRGENMGILEIIAVVLIIMWVGGLSLHIAGGLIHILLVIAVIVFLLRFIRKGV